MRTVEYGSGTESGSAYMTLRVPIGSVQAAIVKFSALGKILDQHVSIKDVQPTLDHRFRQMQAVLDPERNLPRPARRQLPDRLHLQTRGKSGRQTIEYFLCCQTLCEFDFRCFVERGDAYLQRHGKHDARPRVKTLGQTHRHVQR